MTDENEELETSQEDIEKEARSMGWAPKEEFRGNKDHWVDAETYVERGRQVLPIMRENNRRLRDEVLTRDRRIDTLESQLQANQTAIEKLEKHYSEANKRAVETARNQLKAELKQAREDDDVDRELEIQEQIGELNQALKDAEQPKKKEPEERKPDGLSPDFVRWQEDNSWFNGTSAEDRKKTKLFSRIAEDLRDEGSTLAGVEFLDEALRLYEEQYGEEEPKAPSKRQVSKVETPVSRGNSGRSKTFADLPKEAKEACWEDVEDLVGPDRRYKTKKEWEDAYTKIYFAE